MLEKIEYGYPTNMTYLALVGERTHDGVVLEVCRADRGNSLLGRRNQVQLHTPRLLSTRVDANLDVAVLRLEVLQLDPALVPSLLGALRVQPRGDVAKDLGHCHSLVMGSLIIR